MKHLWLVLVMSMVNLPGAFADEPSPEELSQELIQNLGCDPFRDQHCREAALGDWFEGQAGQELSEFDLNEINSQSRPKLYIVIDKAADVQELVAYGTDGNFSARWLVSTGKELDEPVITDKGSITHKRTPTGTYRVSFMKQDYESRTWGTRRENGSWDGADMPYAIFFTDGVAIHGTGWPGTEAARIKDPLLGTRQSGGCVRVKTENAATLFQVVSQQYGAKNTIIRVIDSSVSGETLPFVDAADPRDLFVDTPVELQGTAVRKQKKSSGLGGKIKGLFGMGESQSKSNKKTTALNLY